MTYDPHLSELKKQTRMMAQKEASKASAGGLLLGLALGVYSGSAPAVILAPIGLAIASYWTTYRKYTKD